MRTKYTSWGRYPRVQQRAMAGRWGESPLPDRSVGPLLPYGNGRSYGDCCLNPRGVALDCRPLDRTLAFDAHRGIVRAEAGKTLADLLQEIVPRGWFLPVTPGTRYVTLGGAVANDVHGKNHHRAGTFGCHVRSFGLLRSDGTRKSCAPDREQGLFAATIGGLGLTGVVTDIELQLQPISSTRVRVLTESFTHLSDYFERCEAWDARHQYTVAWIDSTARGRWLGRGLAMMADHVETAPPKLDFDARDPGWGIPCELPFSVLSGPVSRLFNTAYFLRGRHRAGMRDEPLVPYFYPLDAVSDWNRLYGRRGFLQYQCVVPVDAAPRVLATMLESAHRAGEGCFLAVLKRFGEIASPGMLSFPRPGFTLALDFAFRGRRTLDLLERFDTCVADVGGAVYPAKDARLSAARFQQFFPRWKAFCELIDPAFSSGFWERVAAPVGAGGEH